MRQQTEDFLRISGYKKLFSDTPEASAYFIPEEGFSNVIAVCDESITDYRSFTEKLIWRFTDSGFADVHLLTLFIANDIKRAMELTADDGFCWIIDQNSGKIIAGDDKVEDFYGLRNELEKYLSVPYSESRFTEEMLEYRPDGKLCIRHIGQRPVVNHVLLILNLFGYVLCILFSVAIYDWGDLRWDQIFYSGQWYRLITHLFLHADPAHLSGNMILLLLIGDIAERALGHIKYGILYAFGGLTAAGVSMLVSYLTGSRVGSVGASGAVFAVTGALLYILLKNHGKLESLTTKKILFLVAYSLYSGFTSTGVDNAAHVGGLIGGFIITVFLYVKHRKNGGIKESL